MSMSRLVLSCVAALLACGSASAQITWTLKVGVATGKEANNTDSSVTATSTGWANTSGVSGAGTSTFKIESAYQLNSYPGLGIYNRDGCGLSGAPASGYCDSNETVQPEHAIDNNQRREMVLVSFSAPVNLAQFGISYRNTDSDMTVLAYTDAANFDVNTKLAGLTWGQLPTSGWSVIGHYADVGTGGPRSTNADAQLFSSHWLIGAYNSLVGNTTCSTCDRGNDHVKLSYLVGTVAPPSGGGEGVPEPSSIALLGLSLLGMLSVSKRRRA